MPAISPAPADLFAPGRRHLVVLAHQDDELPYAGTLRRLLPHARIVFVTNGDGLAPEARMEPNAYAAVRQAESTRALDVIGYDASRLGFFGFSELELYAAFAAMVKDARPAGPRAMPEVFDRVAARVDEEVRAFAPDVVWTMGWQGGHPEHDLAHLATVRAVRDRDARDGTATPIFEFPAYELIVVAFRFRPWDPRPRHRVTLTADELAAKAQMLQCYPSQERVISQLRGTVVGIGRAARLVGRGFDLMDFFAVEEFAPVGPRDYTRSTHATSRVDYPFDDYQGTPIRFDATLARIATAWEMGR